VTIRILANREPYSSYAEASRPDDTNDPSGPFIFFKWPRRMDDPSPDIIVIPAEDFLVLRPVYSADRGKGTIYVAYGSVALMERAFDSGCADYIREPWALPELRARIGRLFGQKFRIGERAVELGRRLLSGKTAAIELSENESRLLRILLLNAPLPVRETRLLRRFSKLCSRRKTCPEPLCDFATTKNGYCRTGLGRKTPRGSRFRISNDGGYLWISCVYHEDYFSPEDIPYRKVYDY